MKKIITITLVAASLFMTSCSKEMQQNFRPTIVHVLMQHDADNMLINSATNCYKQDFQYQYDSDFVYNTMHPDTLAAKNYRRMDSHYKTGRIDSSFIFAGELVNLIGPIEHREYTFTAKIKSIDYGTMQ